MKNNESTGGKQGSKKWALKRQQLIIASLFSFILLVMPIFSCGGGSSSHPPAEPSVIEETGEESGVDSGEDGEETGEEDGVDGEGDGEETEDEGDGSDDSPPELNTTSPTAAVSPVSGSAISENQQIVVTFNESMDTGTLVLGGSMESEGDDGVWSTATYTNDTLTISPASVWSEGLGITLTIDCDDLAGDSVDTINLSYDMIGPNVVFGTSVTGNGDLSSWADAGGDTGLAAGDAICQARADAAGLTGNFAAWLSDDNDDAYCRIHNLTGKKSANCGQSSLPVAAGPWVRTDGFPFGESINQLLNSGTVYTPVRYDEFGTLMSGQSDYYFTGSTQKGTLSSSNPSPCSNWTSGADSYVISSSPNTTSYTWSAIYSSNCDYDQSLLCFQTGTGPSLPAFSSTGKKTFVTSVSGTGDLSSWADAGGNTGLAAGDAICQARAGAAGLANAANFKAWLSDSSTDAKDRLTSDGPWVRLDGVKVADSNADLIDGSLFTTINLTETGTYYGSTYAWTGTSYDGIKKTNTCNDWIDGTDTYKGARSYIWDAGTQWSDAGWGLCSFTFFYLYCFED